MYKDIKVNDVLYSSDRVCLGNEKIEKYLIVGETTKSWLIARIDTEGKLLYHTLCDNKVSKKELKLNIRSYGYKQFYTEKEHTNRVNRKNYLDIIQRYVKPGYSGSIPTEVLKKFVDIIDEEKAIKNN
jgi:hypothetical protein